MTTHVPVEAVEAAAWEGRDVASWKAAWKLPELHVFESVGSTNDIVRARAEAGAAAGTTAIANVQTSGRGRRQRPWVTPAGQGLLFSMLLRPATSSPAEFAGTIPLRVGMAIARAIDSVTDVAPLLKWPNDVLARDGRKLAGILCESMLSATTISYTVVGIGINVFQGPDDFDDEIRPNATSLAMLTSAPPTRARLAAACMRELQSLCGTAVTALSGQEQDEYARRDALAGRPVSVDGRPAGTAYGIADTGGLNVFEANERRLIHSGTVRVLA